MNAKEFQSYLDSLKESTTTRGHSSGVAAEVTAYGTTVKILEDKPC